MRELKCKIIAECSNGPCTYLATQYLERKKIPIIPDLICNTGTSIGSYLEWMENYKIMKYNPKTQYVLIS